MEMHQDAALLQGYRDGEAWAFEKLYRGHTVAVERFLQGGFT